MLEDLDPEKNLQMFEDQRTILALQELTGEIKDSGSSGTTENISLMEVPPVLHPDSDVPVCCL